MKKRIYRRTARLRGPKAQKQPGVDPVDDKEDFIYYKHRLFAYEPKIPLTPELQAAEAGVFLIMLG